MSRARQWVIVAVAGSVATLTAAGASLLFEGRAAVIAWVAGAVAMGVLLGGAIAHHTTRKDGRP